MLPFIGLLFAIAIQRVNYGHAVKQFVQNKKLDDDDDQHQMWRRFSLVVDLNKENSPGSIDNRHTTTRCAV